MVSAPGEIEVRQCLKEKELPFGVKRPPQVASTKSALCDVDDHIGKSSVMVDTWWNGEGVTISCQRGEVTSQIELQWSEWEAVKLCVSAVLR